MIITSESHLDHGLTPAQVEYIKRLFRDRKEFFKETITLPASLGTVETALVGPASGADAVDESDVRYVTRAGRKCASRVLTVPQPRPRVRTVTAIAGPDGGEPCVLYTAYGGPLAPREPGDPDIATQNELAESRAFWSEHALIVDDVRSNTRHIAGESTGAGHGFFPSGARVLVDGRDEAIVKTCFPEGSSSYMFPHYKVDFVGGDKGVVVALKRVGVDRKTRSNPMGTRQDMTVEEFDEAIAGHKYTSVGSYPLFFITKDGEALSFDTAKAEADQIREAIRDEDNSGWRVVAVDVNWEDPELYDSHSGERIESAYAEDDAPKPVERNAQPGHLKDCPCSRCHPENPDAPGPPDVREHSHQACEDASMCPQHHSGSTWPSHDEACVPSTRSSEWRKRQIILPPELVTELSQWHASQDDPLYALSSTGAADLVSLSMIDAALASLEDAKREAELSAGEMGGPFVKQIDDVQGDLSTVRQFWKEHSAQESGMDTEDEDFTWEYDKRDYGLPPEDEAAIETGSG